MEAPEQEAMGSHSSSSSGECPYPSAGAPTASLKRKRTKRQRAAAPAPSSSASSANVSATTEEEEDMAHCLILLAQGRTLDSPPPEKFTSRKFTQTTTTAGVKAGFYVYECKTCNKCFPSFQALGGHRASHKKPKLAEDAKQLNNYDQQLLDFPPAANSPTGNKMRVHECSTCGAEFSSGQALGGHMRRHRPIGAAPELPQLQEVVKKERNVLSLDLNLPAPSDENPNELQNPLPLPTVAFPFADKRQLAFSPASALVDCHY